jgi:spore germination cell wall hydrolase CwlJ-like protein
MESKSYPDSVCGVVYQGRHKPSWKDEAILVPIRWRCQFSWYCDGKPDIVRDTDLFNEMVHLSIDVWRGRHEDMTGGSLFYHADYVQPSWAKSMVMVTQIDRHMFYRMAN